MTTAHLLPTSSADTGMFLGKLELLSFEGFSLLKSLGLLPVTDHATGLYLNKRN